MRMSTGQIHAWTVYHKLKKNFLASEFDTAVLFSCSNNKFNLMSFIRLQVRFCELFDVNRSISTTPKITNNMVIFTFSKVIGHLGIQDIKCHLLFIGHVTNIKCFELFQPVLPSHPKSAIFFIGMIFIFVAILYFVPIFMLIVPSPKPFCFRPWISNFHNFRCSTRQFSFPWIIWKWVLTWKEINLHKCDGGKFEHCISVSSN